MLGVTIAYYANNRATSRWFLNGESARLPKIAELLGYSSASHFNASIKKYGLALLLTKGLDKLRELNNGGQ